MALKGFQLVLAKKQARVLAKRQWQAGVEIAQRLKVAQPALAGWATRALAGLHLPWALKRACLEMALACLKKLVA